MPQTSVAREFEHGTTHPRLIRWAMLTESNLLLGFCLTPLYNLLQWQADTIQSAAITVSMPSDQMPSVEDIHAKILEDGFYFSQDPALGLRIERMDNNGTVFASPNGLRFCKDNVLDNVVSTSTPFYNSTSHSCRLFDLSLILSSNGLAWDSTGLSGLALVPTPSGEVIPNLRSTPSSSIL